MRTYSPEGYLGGFLTRAEDVGGTVCIKRPVSNIMNVACKAYTNFLKLN